MLKGILLNMIFISQPDASSFESSCGLITLYGVMYPCNLHLRQLQVSSVLTSDY